MCRGGRMKPRLPLLTVFTPSAPPGQVGSETRYVLDAVIGKIHGIGVENLRGSGTIAGETARAYNDVFTLSYVTGRRLAP